jgi:D-alanine-D-alanine ligase
MLKIAFTHNLKSSSSEAEAEFDTPETIAALKTALINLGHEVHLVEVSGPPSRVIARLEALHPDLVFNTAEGHFGRYREAFYPAVFEQLSLPFTGSDAYVCTLSLDKDMTKRTLREAGIPTPRSVFLTSTKQLKKLDLRFPLILKPNFEGSSKGITQDSVVENEKEFNIRISDLIKRYPSGILVEEYIVGTDITVPYIEGLKTEFHGVMSPVEYSFATEALEKRKYNIYDYELKNTESDYVRVHCPANLDPEVTREIQTMSHKIVQVLGLRDFARMDFRLSDSGHIYFIEVNALPSLEPGAGIYMAAEEAGLATVEETLEAILKSARKRHGLEKKTSSPRKSRKYAKVGFTYNLKRIIPGDNIETDAEAEYDSPKTIAAIKAAIESLGHEVVELEATSDLPVRLGSSEVDVVFNIAEGFKGRNREAQVPALLELLDIPYSGSDSATLALALDKGLAKKVVRAAGVPTAMGQVFFTGREKLNKELSFPLIVKPVAEGSSKGVLATSVVHTEAELKSVVEQVLARYKQGALVEEFLPGREFTIALIGEKRPRVLPAMEIVFKDLAGAHPVYSYQHKLDPRGEVENQVPARVDESLRKRLEQVAKGAFIALGCRDFARIDIRLNAKGDPCFIECNPLPGLTPGWSDLCLISEGSGIDYKTLISELLSPAIRRWKEKNRMLLPQQKVVSTKASEPVTGAIAQLTSDR